MPNSVNGPEGRSLEDLRRHYEVETRLANRLRSASREERLDLYSSVYDELYRTVENHPTASKKPGLQEVERAVRQQIRFLRRFLVGSGSFLEVGPGGCALSFEVCNHVRKVIAVDVSAEVTAHPNAPENFTLTLEKGGQVKFPEGSFDVAYSNQVIEHLHPEDGLEQLRGVHRCLKAGGVYICITPNRLNGPHDISRYFSEEACGFHLKEYTVRELREAFHRAGFRAVRPYVGTRGVYMRFPFWVVAALERLIERLPRGFSRRLARTLPVRALLGIRVVARKMP